MKKIIVLFVPMVFGLLFSMFSCGGGGGSGGTTVPPTYNGTWIGTTSQGKPISFTITNNALISIALGSNVIGNFCTVDGETGTSLGTPQSIIGNAFSFTSPGSGPSALSYTVSTTFSSATSASGNVQFTLNQSFPNPTCNGNASGTWNAVKADIVNATGTWSGNISTNTLPSSPIALNLAQTGSAVSGTYGVASDAGTFSGSVYGNMISFELNQTTSGCLGNFNGSGHVNGNSVTFTFTGSDCRGSHTGQGSIVKQ